MGRYGVLCLPVLQVLYRSKALESAVDHDGHSGAESLTFLHTDHEGTRKNTLTCNWTQNYMWWIIQSYSHAL